ncbi:MAG: hypothetical protein RR353_04950 [Victivallaceae bacterium]
MSSQIEINNRESAEPFNRDIVNEANTSSSTGTERLRILGITLLVIGLLLIITGIALASALSNPLLLTVAAFGLMLTIPGAVLLLKATRKEGAFLPSRKPSLGLEKPERMPREMFTPNQIRETLLDLFDDNSYSGWNKTFFENKKGLQLVFAQGNLIENQHVPAGVELVSLLVNAANPQVAVTSGGTNGVISKMTSSSAWAATKPKVPLKPGQFTMGPWAPSGKFAEEEIHWDMLCQFLGPTAEQCRNDPEILYRILQPGFEQLFRQCLDKGINFIQLPLISCGIYAPLGDRQQEVWKQAVVAAILSALTNVESDVRNGRTLCVVIVDLGRRPLEDIIN